MLKKLSWLAAAAVAIALFACSDDSDGWEDNEVQGGESSSSDNSGDGSSSPGNSSSSEPGGGTSSSSADPYVLISDFDGDLPDNIVAYVFGSATEENDEEEELDEDDNPTGNFYKVWNPDGILTLKNFSFNDGSTTSGANGGGLMIKEIEVKNYSAFQFKVRATRSFHFRIKAEVPNVADPDGEPLSAAYRLNITDVSATEFKTIEVFLNSLNLAYDNIGLDQTDRRADLIERATIIEFYMTGDGTLEIDDFKGLVVE